MSVRQASSSNAQIGSGSGEGVKAPDREENVFGTCVYGTKGVAEDCWFEEASVLGQFRRPSFRDNQREAIVEIAKAFESGYRHIILDAPTGSGKSDIAACFAFASADAHVVSVTKLLQDQYQNSFPDMFVMKGRNAYPCVMGEPGDTCADGPCQRKKIQPHGTCPYVIAKGTAMVSDVTVHNFDSFYYQNSYGTGFPGRKLLIVDEAHNIPNKFTGFLSFTIDSRGDVPVPEFESISDYDEFVKMTLKETSTELAQLEALFNAGGLMNKDQLHRMKDMGSQVKKMRTYLREREGEGENHAEFVFDYSEYGRYAPKVTFRPVFVGRFARRWLFNYGERVILMSATILDKQMFCKEVGINPDAAYYLQLPSTFPPENRPILKKYAGSMSYRNIDDTLPNIANRINQIVSKFPNQKGIIQTHSEKIASYLQSMLYDRRFTFNKDFKRPQDMLESHIRKDGSFIIASGLREGLDLYDDMSRVQVLCKIPYPSMGDKVVRRKMELDPDWYGWMTTVMFVQSLGRSIRSPTDKAVTYILDSGFGFFYKRNKRFIPEYIQQAIRW